MDRNKIRSYISRLLDSISDNNALPYNQEDGLRTEFMARGDLDFILELDKYEKIRKALLEKELWGEKFTEEYIDKKLKELLFRIREEGNKSNAPIYFSELVNEVETFSQEQIVYVPLNGIQLVIENIEIGNVKLFNMTDERYDNLAKQVESIIARPELANEQRQQILQHWLAYLKGCVCAEYRCVAEQDRARERADEECQRILDLLRYSIHMMGQDHYRIAVGRLGEVNRYIKSTPVISSDTQNFSLSSHSIGPLALFPITSETIERWEQIGVFKVAEFLKQKLEEDSFGETLLRGFRWFSNAQIQIVKENQFLNLMTCLETFLARRGVEQVTISVAEGVAFVLATELAERRRLKNKIVDFYDSRSRISHGGHSAILNSELEELRSIAGDFLMSMTQKINVFRNRADLDVWIENQKFG